MDFKLFNKIYFIVLYFLIVSCTADKPCSNCGIVIAKIYFYDTTVNKYISKQTYGPDTKVWFKDSLVIEKAMGINIAFTNGHETGRKVIFMNYTFINLSKKSVYEYNSFSDTAKLVKKYILPDWNNGDVGWKFYAYKDLPRTESPEQMNDTVMNGILYKRLRLISKKLLNGRENKQITIAYFRCDKKGTMFQYDKHLSESIGCPMISFYNTPTPQNPFAAAADIEFVTNTLTQEELKVFAAWERNAKLNPVK